MDEGLLENIYTTLSQEPGYQGERIERLIGAHLREADEYSSVEYYPEAEFHRRTADVLMYLRDTSSSGERIARKIRDFAAEIKDADV